MEEHYNGEIYLETLVQMNYIGQSWLIKQLKYHLGLSPMKYLNSLRIEKAARLFQEGYDIDSVAKQTGFSDRLYFSKVFKAKIGVSPAAYQKQQSD